MSGLYTEDGGHRVSDATLLASIGSPTDAAWNGTDPSATLISIMKAIATAP